MLSTVSEIRQALQDRPDILPYARMVGRWAWVEFPARPPLETRRWLKEAGFHWNKERNAWQHPCGYRSKHAPYDPREKYESIPLELATN
jgi:hypothetical protein